MCPSRLRVRVCSAGTRCPHEMHWGWSRSIITIVLGGIINDVKLVIEIVCDQIKSPDHAIGMKFANPSN